MTREVPGLHGDTRRRFLSLTGAAIAGSTCATALGRDDSPPPDRDDLELGDVPIFCAHEHWGSINSVGTFPGGFRADIEAGATPQRTTRLIDLLLDPYLGGWLSAEGHVPDELARRGGAPNILSLAEESSARAMQVLRPALDGQRLTGAYQCIRRGIELLHGVDIDNTDASAIDALDAAIGRRYQRMFGWYREAMDHARLTRLVRPVHPEFYYQEASAASAAEERTFTGTLMRIDPLLELGPTQCPRRETLAAFVGIEPRDAGSWREFIGRLFDRIAAQGALGIKQAQAYRRGLDFRPRRDDEVKWSGDRSPAELVVWEDWIVHECCRQAHDRQWPHQIHVGTTNLAASSPLPLDALALQYPQMRMVFIHCWPFFDESAWIAKHRPNVYLDTCWLPILNPVFFQRALTTWLPYVPEGKITCSNDATSVEMAAGSSRFTREILGRVLQEHRGSLGIDVACCQRTAANLLHHNAARLYGSADQ